MKKQQDEKPLDAEEACKTWDCHDFVCLLKVMPVVRIIRFKTCYKCYKQMVDILPVGLRVPNTTKAAKIEKCTSSTGTFITNTHKGARME